MRGTPTGHSYYDPQGDELYFRAFYPSDLWTIDAENKVATRAFDGSTDLMAAEEVSSNKTTATIKPQFIFKHLLTQLRINFVADNDEAIKEWGEVTNIELVNTNTILSHSLNGGEDVFTQQNQDPDKTESLLFYEMSKAGDVYKFTDIPLTTNRVGLSTTSKPGAYVLAQAIDTKDQQYSLKIYSANAINGVVVPITLQKKVKTTDADGNATTGLEPFTGNTKGWAFEITLTFKDLSNIEAKAETEPWIEDGVATVDVD